MQMNVTHVGKTADSEENVGIIFPSFVKDVRPPIQELRSSPISFLLVGGSGVECKMALHCRPRVGQWHCLKSGLHLLLRCAAWVLLAGRGRWQLAEQEAVLGRSQGGATFVRGNSFRVLALPFGWSWVAEIGRSCILGPDGGESPAASDDWTAALTLGAAVLLFLGVENGEDCFIKNRFETFLGQGRAFQVALRSNRFCKLHPVLVSEGLLLHIQQAGQGFGVITEVNLAKHKWDKVIHVFRAC